MNTKRLKAKKFFLESSKTEYDTIITEAFLTRRQEQIALLKRVEDLPTWEIANRLCVSPETITRELAHIYDKISKVIVA